MKKMLHAIYTGLGAVVATALMLVGCIDDNLVKTNDVVEGVPITVNLTLSGAPVADVTVETKASGSDLSDVGDLVVFIFRNDGTFESVATNYNGSTSLKIVSSVEENGNRLYNVSFSTTSGTKKMLALANIADGGYWEGIIDQLTDGYNAKISFDDLKKMVVNLDSDLIAESQTSDGTPPFHIAGESQMLISGWNEGIVFDTSGDVTDNGTYGIEESTVILQMRRAMAHINFEIAAKPTDAKGTFTPTSYQVYNIPTKSYAINDLQGVTALKLTTNITDVDYIHTTSENIGVAQGGKYSFNFYMPENVQPSGSGATSYADREKWYEEGTSTSGASAASKDWDCAPQYSTFVVISGTYEGGSGEDGGTNVIANVEYTVHLGDFSENNGFNFNDFTVKRNVSYTYKMSVLGVDNIIVEATTSDEKQSGAEGSVYDQTNTEYSYNLDAHYEQVFLEYNLSNIVAELKKQNLTADKLDEAIANQLVLVIQSEAMDYNANGVVNKRGSLKPYEIYVKNATNPTQAKAAILNGDMDGREKPSKGFDYKWIEFWPQTADETIAAYPGMSSWAMDDLKAKYTGESPMANQQFYASADGQTDNGNGDPKKLKDVYDVIVAMGKAIKSIYSGESITTGSMNEDGIIITNAGTTSEPEYVARFTAFVNEYYYLRHPLTGAKETSWSVMTNKIPREMIIAMSTQTSPDGNSSYSKIHSYISQLSMQTFYNDRVSSLNAFGIETYNETPVTFYFGNPASSTNLTIDDGRENQKILIGASSNPKWTDYINTNNGWIKSVGTDHETHKLDGDNGLDAYKVKDVYSACMSRNRDLNGNGKIDENEIRWYLASLNEYIRIGIGATAISSAARLYIGDKTNLKDPVNGNKLTGYPYNEISNGSLFYTSSGADYRVFWAIEKGSYNNEETTSSGTNPWYVKRPLPIRCIRNLPDASGNTENRDISSINGVKSDATFVSHPKSGNEPIVLEFRDRLVSSLYRQRTSQLGIHNEDGKANSYYQGIYVAESFLPGTYKLGNIIGYVGSVGNYSNNGTVENPCWGYEEGGYTRWRVPNLIEMTAMHAAGLLNSCSTDGAATCCTQFTKQDVRYGFARSSLIYCPGEIGKEGDISGGYRIRCVRDVDEGYGFTTPVGDVKGK